MRRVTSMFLGEQWENVHRVGDHSLPVLTEGPVATETSLIRIPRQGV